MKKRRLREEPLFPCPPAQEASRKKVEKLKNRFQISL